MAPPHTSDMSDCPGIGEAYHKWKSPAKAHEKAPTTATTTTNPATPAATPATPLPGPSVGGRRLVFFRAKKWHQL